MSIDQIKNKIIPILKKNGVKKAAVFGSYARGDYNKKSDVDILIEYAKEDKSYFDLISIQLELEKKLDKKVHLLTFGGIHPYLRKVILGSKKDVFSTP